MDSGRQGRDLETLLEVLEGEGLQVRAVLTSHAHIDHTGGHQALKERYGAELIASLFNAAVLENPLGLRAYFYASTYRSVLAFSREMGARIDRLILPGQEEVEVDGARFHILPLPGHAPEHMGFVTPDAIAYLADLLLGAEQLDAAKLPYTVSCELDFASKERAIGWHYPGYLLAHRGYVSQIGPLVRANLALWQDRLQTVLEQLEEEQTLEDCVAGTAGALGLGGRNPFTRKAVERTIRAMVQYLVDQGQVVQRFQGWRDYYRRV